jgi:hypothetical protein
MEHFLKSPWLMRASELKGKTGETAPVLEEHVEIRDCSGRTYVVRSRSRRCSWRRRGVVEVLERWREVRGWWVEDNCTDRMVFTPEKRFSFLVERIRDLREVLVGTRGLTPKVVSASGAAFLRAGRRGRRRAG